MVVVMRLVLATFTAVIMVGMMVMLVVARSTSVHCVALVVEVAGRSAAGRHRVAEQIHAAAADVLLVLLLLVVRMLLLLLLLVQRNRHRGGAGGADAEQLLRLRLAVLLGHAHGQRLAAALRYHVVEGGNCLLRLLTLVEPDEGDAARLAGDLVAQNVLLHDQTVLAEDHVHLLLGNGLWQIGHVQVRLLDLLAGRPGV